MTTVGGYFLQNDIHCFDNSFFGINNLEAKYMDPQQRQILEVVYECLESAGIPMQQISGSNIGCYVANFTTDYTTMQSGDPDAFHRLSATGMEPSILANRVSHVFNLKGPSCTINTACSSSLYALHLACTALEAGECTAAVVAGANLIQSPEMQIGVVKTGVVSGTSTSHTFDTAADGYGRGEAVGALLVKRLEDAIRDGDPIRSVIRGTAINSADGQEAVMRKAYAKAGLPLDETDYIEAHGTGTPVGDPIVGSVKTNLGHSEAVSGISSIIKVVLALEKGFIPPTIGIRNLNPALKLKERNVEVLTKLIPWPNESFRRASINSFGYGGANSHIILESAERHVPKLCRDTAKITSDGRKTYLLPFSANSESSLQSGVERITLQKADLCLEDLAYTLSCRRSRFSSRGFIIAHQNNFQLDLVAANLKVPEDTGVYPSSFAFLFTGQGAQWPQMGRELLEEFSICRGTIDRLDDFLATLPNGPSWRLKDEIMEPQETSRVHQALFTQPLTTAIQIVLFQLLGEWGIRPRAAVGHSSGEIAAAFAAGYLTAREAIGIAYYRGLVVSQSRLSGAMIAVGLDRLTAQDSISKLMLEGHIRIACINSPESVTISGDLDAVIQITSHFQSEGTFVRRLKTDGKAYHSHHMAVLGQEYEELLSAANLLPAAKLEQTEHLATTMVSSVTGRKIEIELARSPAYWRQNLESPVLFNDAVQQVTKGHHYQLIELGPHPALKLPIQDIRKKLQLQQNQMPHWPTLLRDKDSVDSMLRLAGHLSLNQEVAFDKINGFFSPSNSSVKPPNICNTLYNLPTYQWSHTSTHWTEPRITSEYRSRKFPRHDLLGSRIPGGSGETTTWRNLLQVNHVPWLKDHKLGESIVFPAAGYIAMAAEAIQQLRTDELPDRWIITFQNLKFLKVFALKDGMGEQELFTEFISFNVTDSNPSTTWSGFVISSVASGTSTVHAKGKVGIQSLVPAFSRPVLLSNTPLEMQAPGPWYDTLNNAGLCFGPSFQSMIEVYNTTSGDRYQTSAKTRFRPQTKSPHESLYLVHPITIDALLQTGIVSSSAGVYTDLHGQVPVSIAQMEIRNYSSSSEALDLCTIHAKSEPVGLGSTIVDAELVDKSGQVLIRINGCKAVSYHNSAKSSDLIKKDQPITKMVWKPDISLLSEHDSDTLTQYTSNFAINCEVRDPTSRSIAGALDLIAHQMSKLRVLELRDTLGSYQEWEGHLKLFRDDIRLKSFRSYFAGCIDPEGGIVAREIQILKNLSAVEQQPRNLDYEAKFDVIILSKVRNRLA
ncbi:Reducing polyketide synthase DEP5 [Lachnellula suecica]|uniref:Reducing polyketide synthase DEP5 n=1 Tax=Lachnellula suecica TaxID=602035 RepID=A0A8T9CHW6_9HELO|nr:Reducing polyketide synthase DEP5 [Lachnellula suecica]